VLSDDIVRDVDAIRLPKWGRVVRSSGPVPWVVVGSGGEPVKPIARFLRDFVARGNAAGSVRSYCFALQRWWRFLRAIGVEWDRVTSSEVRDFVLWLQRAAIARQAPRRQSAKTAGRVNPITRKQYPGDSYQVRTVRHGNAVLRSCYDHWIELGSGPLVNPVPRQRARPLAEVADRAAPTHPAGTRCVTPDRPAGQRPKLRHAVEEHRSTPGSPRPAPAPPARANPGTPPTTPRSANDARSRRSPSPPLDAAGGSPPQSCTFTTP